MTTTRAQGQVQTPAPVASAPGAPRTPSGPAAAAPARPATPACGGGCACCTPTDEASLSGVIGGIGGIGGRMQLPLLGAAGPQVGVGAGVRAGAGEGAGTQVLAAGAGSAGAPAGAGGGGDDCCSMDGPVAEDAPDRLLAVPQIRWTLLAGGLLVAGWVLGRFDGGPVATVGTVVTVAALLVGASTFVPDAIRGLLRGRVGVGTLMTLAAAGAVALGELGEAAVLAFLFSAAEGLEAYAVTRTRRGLRALLDLVPAEAVVLRGGQEVSLPPGDLRVGEVLLVRPGARVATDGVVTAGRSAIDTSAVTGESIPVETGPGDQVHAGTVNGGGVLQVRVTATVADNSLARVVHIVEQAQERKSATQRVADRLARPLVPGVMVLAALVAVVGSLLGDPSLWLERALVVLVAAAPCAMVMSVPVAVVSAVGSAARSGVLVKGGAALEALGGVRTVALDKTGTLTRGTPVVVDVVAAPGHDRDQVLTVAAALEAHSEHPLAAAVLDAVTTADGQVTAAADVVAHPGAGLTGTVAGRPARLGRPGFVAPGQFEADLQRLQAAGATAVLVEHDGQLLGVVAVRDELRPEARAAVVELGDLGVRVVMLTGDNALTAHALAAEAGLDSSRVHADLRPQDKARIVEELRAQAAGGRRLARWGTRGVAMVGDGINDAPALATADVGIAMGAIGTDVAIETADVALMGEDLRHLPATLRQARRARRIMLQSLLLSLLILAVLVPLAGAGVLGLAVVVLVHELAEIVVIGNGIRAARRRPALPPVPHPATGPNTGNRPNTGTRPGAGGDSHAGTGADAAARRQVTA